jgi:hypothetical protein
MGLHMETLWEKLLFWKKKPTLPKEGVDYVLYDFSTSSLTGIHLISGVYQDVIYYYETAKFIEEGDYAVLKFTYQITNTGKYTEEQLQNDSKFVTMMGDILTDLMENNEPTRKNDTKKPGIQRRLHKEGSPFH